MINYGLYGFNTINVNGTDTNKLFSIYGNDLVNVDTGLGYKLNIPTSNYSSSVTNRKFSMVSFLGRCFLFSNVMQPISYNGTNWLRDFTPQNACPWGSIAKSYKERIYLADTIIPYMNYDLTNPGYYKSRIFYSDLPVNDKLTWGIGIIQPDGPVLFPSENLITSGLIQRAYFKSNRIKVGDPLYIPFANNTNANLGAYTVSEVVDEYKIRITEKFPNSSDSDFAFWVGSNWFDVNTDDNDYITALEENNNRLIIFKNDSLYRYDTSSLVKVKNVPGTTSKDSVINIKDYTIYFHGSNKEKTGFYLYDGVTSQRISNAIQPFIEGILAANYTNVVAWREGDVYRAYVGNIDNTNSSNPAYNISKTNTIFSYNVPNNEWRIDTCNHVIKAATTMRESNAEKIFVQDDSGKVFQMNYGNSFSGANIPFKLETQPYYPRGSEIMSRFTRVKIVSRDARGVSVSYKLWDTPLAVDSEYHGLGDIEDDTTEFLIPTEHCLGCGIQLMFSESGITEPNYHIEKISIYHDSDITVTPERKDQR